ncbi:hypothetical protein PZB75_30675 (plasmid) [Streptomyces sp. AM 4-1-1]|uniref:hypothetical protein n=1 Tax=Streptomyces sp. AM 4-1-1 TaxID=3028710 RepID=UPI0023B8F220|nr:hypothetical protein [Streptomyces sp. AM 4-1-1]WEH37770.1 hypothetical protein PZB75_30675 [Streptomyces sp. AM 4-1-1]
MIDLEERVNRVFNPDLRPLVGEAYRCYASGSARGAIVLTWTAVCADLIAKAQILHEEGESHAKDLVADVERAQGSAESEAIPIMLGLEKTLLDTAEKLELIDFTQRKQLERIRDDRHLCAHPSIRPLGELYEPTMEYARAHLAAALDAVLIHPPSQGRKIVDSFLKHVVDPGFVYDTEYLTHTFFDRVRPSARSKVVEAAAKFAVLAIEDPAIKIKPEKFADRMAKCLRSFAARDADLVKKAVAKQMTRLETAEPSVQLQALGRLGDLPAFWASLGTPVRNLLNTKIETIGTRAPYKDITTAEAKALVAHPELRKTLPALTTAFSNLWYIPRADIIEQRPDPYFTPFLPALLKDVGTFDRGQEVAEKAVLPCAGFLSLPELEQVLTEWNENDQCWGRAMPGYLVELYTLTSHLGDGSRSLWAPILEEVRSDDRVFTLLTSGIGSDEAVST